ncbi:Exodeoxyribonuclease 7 large subunit [uncultured archaeon]|nr:Exodeoxyribonuclease 7 large subunit [uncultured archaeon]
MFSEEKGIYTVREFTLAIKGVLTDGKFNDVWIRGEISNFTNHSSGHRYFTLKDKSSSLQCVMFKWHGSRLRFELEHGMKVLVLGDVDVYEPKGQYQLNVRAIRPDGVGELYKAYEQLKKKLESEGLFSPDHKKPLPRYPKKIGVATSLTGAVLHDILTVLKRRYPVDVLFIPTIVQGEYAAKSIVHSLDVLNRTDVDLIIMGRGGGSIEDLWAFNEEIVARSIFRSRIPVISAVGHETDFTIADFVADARAPTPSAAAEVAVPDRQELHSCINRIGDRLNDKQRQIIKDQVSYISELEKGVDPHHFLEQLADYMQHIDAMAQRQALSARRLVEGKMSLFSTHAGKLDAVSPLGTLSRGYSITMKLPGKTLVRSIGDVEKMDELSVIVKDGKIKCNVNDKEVCKWK